MTVEGKSGVTVNRRWPPAARRTEAGRWARARRPRGEPSVVAVGGTARALAWVVMLVAGPSGCDGRDSICAGPCAKSGICGASLPSVSYGSSDLFGSLNAEDCVQSCKTSHDFTPDPCRPRLYDFFDCYAQADCDTLRSASGLILECQAELQRYQICITIYSQRCCFSGDDRCGAAGNHICECPGADWDRDDCNLGLTFPTTEGG